MKKPVGCLSIVLTALLAACQPEPVELPKKMNVPATVMAKLRAAGFDTSEGFSKYKGGYLVEYDIFLTEAQIDELTNPVPRGRDQGARVEHYRTNNLVTGTPRVLRVYLDAGFDQYLQNAFDAALRRYNALSLGLSFQRATGSSAADIRIFSFYERSSILGYSAGFPSGGNPASPIQLNTYYYNSASRRADAATVIAHEIGHAIGFRHTDFMNRAFSCRTGGNEGDANVGAVLIPGTPTAPSAGSWMLACSNNTDRPFTPQDNLALTNTYPRNRSILSAGEELRQGNFLRSPDGRFTLILQEDGNLVIYDASNRPLWASNTPGQPQITRCVMQADGNLVLYDNNGRPYWDSGTYQYPGSLLVMQNDGNLVIYRNDAPRWASNTCCY
ncbi:MAG: hypothetical protein H7Z75_07990 [Ferruginibacter sp.]|nr:hypothetical protein [Cytophagales bacterium]